MNNIIVALMYIADQLIYHLYFGRLLIMDQSIELITIKTGYLFILYHHFMILSCKFQINNYGDIYALHTDNDVNQSGVYKIELMCRSITRICVGLLKSFIRCDESITSVIECFHNVINKSVWCETNQEQLVEQVIYRVVICRSIVC